METQNNSNICDIVAEKDENLQKVEATQTITQVAVSNLLSSMPSTLPTLEYNFEPPAPNKRYFVPTLSNRLLTRKIYIEMLKTIRAYGELEKIAPQEDKQTILNLRNQMEILSLAMLNIYGKTTERNRVPFFSGGGINLSRDYNKALFQMYDRVYHIHNLVLSIITKTTDNNIKTTLIIIYTNLKSQLQTLFDLRT